MPGQTLRLRAAGIDHAVRQHRQFMKAFG